jgi:flagellar basal-body rod modification protein FlgD
MTIVNNVTNTTNTTTTPDSASTTSASATSASSLQSTFLQLLVAQMQNQNPTSPLDSSQMTSQLAQINTVTGISQLNTTLQSVQSQLTATQQLQASALIGKSVFAPGTSVTVASGTATSTGVQLSGSSSDVQAVFKNSSGTIVRTIDLGAQSAGVVAVNWNGADNSGNVVPDGTYTMSVTAAPASSTSAAITATPLTMSAITSVVQEAGGAIGVTLTSGTTVPLTSVAQVF